MDGPYVHLQPKSHMNIINFFFFFFSAASRARPSGALNPGKRYIRKSVIAFIQRCCRVTTCLWGLPGIDRVMVLYGHTT